MTRTIPHVLYSDVTFERPGEWAITVPDDTDVIVAGETTELTANGVAFGPLELRPHDDSEVVLSGLAYTQPPPSYWEQLKADIEALLNTDIWSPGILLSAGVLAARPASAAHGSTDSRAPTVTRRDFMKAGLATAGLASIPTTALGVEVDGSLTHVDLEIERNPDGVDIHIQDRGIKDIGILPDLSSTYSVLVDETPVTELGVGETATLEAGMTGPLSITPTTDLSATQKARRLIHTYTNNTDEE